MAAETLLSFEPMHCEGTELPPEGEAGNGRYELKLNGFRAFGGGSARNVQL
jgi:hypothetical protein